jgi:predicted O-linked N-acetylglucosamine transferase (SPINDLY family)
MDYQCFFEQLPQLCKDRESPVIRAKTSEFQAVVDQVGDAATIQTLQLLNLAVKYLEPGEVYCQVGCFPGSHLIGALLNHPEQQAYAVEDLSELAVTTDPLSILVEHLSDFGIADQVYFSDQGVLAFFADLREAQITDKIGVYFYNGSPDYSAHLLALELVQPFLADHALIILSHSHLNEGYRASADFVAVHAQAQVLQDFTGDRWSAAGCGLQVLGWDTSRQRIPERNWKFYHLDQAEAVYQQVIAVYPEYHTAYLILGDLLQAQQHWEAVIAVYRQALLYTPKDPELLNNLGRAFSAQGNQAAAALYFGNACHAQSDYQTAVQHYQTFLETEPAGESFYIFLGDCYQRLDQWEQAISTYRQGLAIYPNSVDLYFYLVIALQASNNMSAAIAVATDACNSVSNSFCLKQIRELMLPVLYETQEEIQQYRYQFSQGLDRLIRELQLDTLEDRKNALTGIGKLTNFYLAYQGCNDLELQKQYGQMVHQVMAASYPDWIKTKPMPPLTQEGKIRIGYLSAYLRNHSGAKWALGWLKHHDRQAFEIYCYHIGSKTDEFTEQFQGYSDYFHYIPDDFERICAQLITDQLHILVFTDIGMDAKTTQLAGMRLASLQCTAWGHPVTSGLPTIDYYLSGQLMEPDNGQDHYSETLVRLPNIGVSYPKPCIDQSLKKRSDFQLREQRLIYLSCQSLFKYLPQHDYLFPAIAQRVTHAQFVFIANSNSAVTTQFRNRLHNAFAESGLPGADYCMILPQQSIRDYFNLLSVVDISLDTLSFSGGNTCLDAIACGLPIVTCPGEFMRSRLASGILKMLGVTDTIAPTEAEYIDIAVRLGLDPEWRSEIVQQMQARHNYLYDDITCVRALEDFYRQVVQSQPMSSEVTE